MSLYGTLRSSYIRSGQAFNYLYVRRGPDTTLMDEPSGRSTRSQSLQASGQRCETRPMVGVPSKRMCYIGLLEILFVCEGVQFCPFMAFEVLHLSLRLSLAHDLVQVQIW
jgi:hypothetical protein